MSFNEQIGVRLDRICAPGGTKLEQASRLPNLPPQIEGGVERRGMVVEIGVGVSAPGAQSAAFPSTAHTELILVADNHKY